MLRGVDERHLEKVTSTFQNEKLEDSVSVLCLDIFMSRCDAWNHGSPLATMREASLETKIIY